MMTVFYTQRFSIPKYTTPHTVLYVSFGRQLKQYHLQPTTRNTCFQYRLQLYLHRSKYNYRYSSFTTYYIGWRKILTNDCFAFVIGKGNRSWLLQRFYTSTKRIHQNNTHPIQQIIKQLPKQQQQPPQLRKVTVIVVGISVIMTTILSTSILIRQWRIRQMELSCVSIDESHHFNHYCHRSISDLISTIHRAGLMGTLLYIPQQQQQQQDDKYDSNVQQQQRRRPPENQQHNHIDPRKHTQKQRKRRAQSVLEELHSIRQWHQENGFYGGFVVRDISNGNNNNENNNDNTIEDDATTTTTSSSSSTTTPNQDTSYYKKVRNYVYVKYINPFKEYIYQQSIARRECYYIYYEISSKTGQQSQHIFIRGTTLWMDIITCIQTYMMYDDEIQCYVHYGFVQHTHRILKDIIPLLSKDATIEISGHSLGGAVASILAMKLHLRGYNVHRLTTIGEPAYLWFNPILQFVYSNQQQQQLQQQRMHIQSLLPQDHIRIEHDCDIVPYLPPFGSHIGNKIWLTRNQPMKNSDNNNIDDLKSNCDVCSTNIYWINASLQQQQNISTWDWTESIWINFCIPEIIQFHRISHRISNYIQQLVSCSNRNNINCNNHTSCRNRSSSSSQSNSTTSDV
jgi:hypothetical protein